MARKFRKCPSNYIKASTDNLENLKQKISDTLYDFIKYDLWGQKGYYKHLRRQFTVNGRKYVVKNDSNKVLHIINPEGEDLYGYYIPDYLHNDVTDNMALSILNDAFGESINNDMKRFIVHVSPALSDGYSTDGYAVYFGKYLEKMQSWTKDGTSGRYMLSTIKSNYVYHITNITWFDDANEAINAAKEFVANGEATAAPTGLESIDFIAGVVDFELGQEIYYDGIKVFSKDSYKNLFDPNDWDYDDEEDIEACGSVECSTKIQGSDDYNRHVSAISFDVVSLNGKRCDYHEIEAITRKVFENMNGLPVPAFDSHDVDFDEDYWIEEYGVRPSQYGADFVWEGSYDERKILQDLSKELSDAGYELLGDDFYSLDYSYDQPDIDQWFED